VKSVSSVRARSEVMLQTNIKRQPEY